MIHRIINPIKSNSFFLFGARGTGKSSLLKQFFSQKEAFFLDLLIPELEEKFNRFPSSLTELIEKQPTEIKWFVIDEVQKAPKLLDLVHLHIEKSNFKFALTGSSARKLKRGSANLLAGRAFVYSLFPLTHVELDQAFDLKTAMEWGTLPKMLQLPEKEEKLNFLRTYAQTYLKEEIQAEQIVRKLNPFRHFLEVAAQTNGQILNYTKIANDIGSDPKTVQSYYEILQDTLVGHLLNPFHRSIRKRQRQNPKFYFFDCGVKRALEKTLTQELLPKTYAFGNSFEHFLINEIIHLHEYRQLDYQFSYLRTKDDAEIDLIVERPGMPTALIEIKSTENTSGINFTNLERFRKDVKNTEAFVFSLDTTPRKAGSITYLHWKQGIQELGLSTR